MEHFVEQSYKDLQYSLTKGAVDHAQFTIIEKQAMTWGKYHIQIYILGESHMAIVQFDKETISEVCACTDICLSKEVECVEEGVLSSFKDTIDHDFQTLSYSFLYEYIPWQEGESRLKTFQRDIVEIPKESGVNSATLMHTFPHAEGEARVPLTLVRARHTDILTLETVHTYPNEEMMVFTKSCWSPRES